MDSLCLLESQFRYCRVLPKNHYSHNDWEHVKVTIINRWYVTARDIIQATNLNCDLTLGCNCPPIYSGTRQVTYQSVPTRVYFRPYVGRPRPPNIRYEDEFERYQG
jgi:hypothetical protein